MNQSRQALGTSPQPTDTNAPAVDARQLSKRYGRTWALRRVDLRVERGELLCLLGPNGSGKTTLLRILSTLTRPTFGAFSILGEPARSRSAILPRIGVLADQAYMYGELTARENLRFAGVMYGLDLDEDSLLEALAGVGLAKVAGREIRTFSSGMRKRLSLARATLHDPELVLMDEPYGALDVEGMAWVDRFVTELRAANRAAIIATHEVDRAKRLCDRALRLDAGRVTYAGPIDGYEVAAE